MLRMKTSLLAMAKLSAERMREAEPKKKGPSISRMKTFSGISRGELSFDFLLISPRLLILWMKMREEMMMPTEMATVISERMVRRKVAIRMRRSSQEERRMERNSWISLIFQAMMMRMAERQARGM